MNWWTVFWFFMFSGKTNNCQRTFLPSVLQHFLVRVFGICELYWVLSWRLQITKNFTLSHKKAKRVSSCQYIMQLDADLYLSIRRRTVRLIFRLFSVTHLSVYESTKTMRSWYGWLTGLRWGSRWGSYRRLRKTSNCIYNAHVEPVKNHIIGKYHFLTLQFSLLIPLELVQKFIQYTCHWDCELIIGSNYTWKAWKIFSLYQAIKL